MISAAAFTGASLAPFAGRQRASRVSRAAWFSAAAGTPPPTKIGKSKSNAANETDAAAAVAAAVAKDEGKFAVKQKVRTGVLMRVPNVSPADDIITSGLKRNTYQGVTRPDVEGEEPVSKAARCVDHGVVQTVGRVRERISQAGKIAPV